MSEIGNATLRAGGIEPQDKILLVDGATGEMVRLDPGKIFDGHAFTGSQAVLNALKALRIVRAEADAETAWDTYLGVAVPLNGVVEWVSGDVGTFAVEKIDAANRLTLRTTITHTASALSWTEDLVHDGDEGGFSSGPGIPWMMVASAALAAQLRLGGATAEINQAETDALDAITNKRTEEVGAVEQAGADQVQLIEDEGADQVQNVTDVGAAKIGEAAGHANQARLAQEASEAALAESKTLNLNIQPETYQLQSAVAFATLSGLNAQLPGLQAIIDDQLAQLNP